MLSALEELTVKLEDKTCPQGNKDRAKAQEQMLATGKGGGPGKRQGSEWAAGGDSGLAP